MSILLSKNMCKSDLKSYNTSSYNMYVPHKGAYIFIFTESLLPVFHNYYFSIGSLHFCCCHNLRGAPWRSAPAGAAAENFSAIHIFLSVRLILCYDIVRV